jgi:Family of unknown function (DUF6174)
MKHGCFALAVLIVVGPISTRGSQRSGGGQPDVLDELLHAERTWRASKIEAYEFRFEYACNGLLPRVPPGTAPIVIRVKDGKSAYVRPGSDPVPVPAALAQYSTVEKLFAFIRKAWTSRPLHVDVQYDQARGYPIRVCVDPGKVTDDEVGFVISDFSVLSNDGVRSGGPADNGVTIGRSTRVGFSDRHPIDLGPQPRDPHHRRS